MSGCFLGSQQCCGPPVEDISVVCRHTPDPLSMEDVCKQKHTQVNVCSQSYVIFYKHK